MSESQSFKRLLLESRILVLIIAAIANYAIIDHTADAFRWSPSSGNATHQHLARFSLVHLSDSCHFFTVLKSMYVFLVLEYFINDNDIPTESDFIFAKSSRVSAVVLFRFVIGKNSSWRSNSQTSSGRFHKVGLGAFSPHRPTRLHVRKQSRVCSPISILGSRLR